MRFCRVGRDVAGLLSGNDKRLQRHYALKLAKGKDHSMPPRWRRAGTRPILKTIAGLATGLMLKNEVVLSSFSMLRQKKAME